MATTQERQKARNAAVEDVVRSAQESPDTEAQAAPDAAEERLDEATSVRAYELYLARGGEDGHDLDDWLRAESEMRQNARSES